MDEKEKIRNLLQSGNPAEAESLCRALIGGTGKHDSQAWLLMAAIQAGSGNLREVESCCRRAIEIDSRLPAAYFNLGIAQQSQGKTDTARASYLKTLEIDPTHAGAHASLGLLALEGNDPANAASHLDTAARSQPQNPALHYHLGNACYRIGNITDAERSYRTALRLSPDDPRINNDLGNLLFSTGRTGEAINHFRTALQNGPESLVIHYNLGIGLWKLGNNSEAFSHCWRALKLAPDNLPARQCFVQLVTSQPPRSLPGEVWDEVARCFKVPGVDGQQLVPLVARHLQDSDPFREFIASASSLDVTGITGKLPDGWHLSLPGNKLLLVTLSHAVITSHDLEVFLTLARKSLLYCLSGDDTTISITAVTATRDFLAAMATQCYLNEYAWFVSPDESRQLDKLRAELTSSLPADTGHDDSLLLRILVLASYEPLNTLPEYTLEFIRSYPPLLACAANVITLQVDEPEKERQLAGNIVSLTAITNSMSCAVREQYEASPYPRWTSVTLHSPRSYRDVLGELFPPAVIPNFRDTTVAMLIAGCGTGKHPLQSATRFRNTHITAIDLSRASLAYAWRKAQEYGIDNIEFYQADILQLENLDQTFDVIESIGVLHHMGDPSRGLEILTDRLAPDGLLHLGLYSSYARRNIIAARKLLHDRGFTPDVASIRNARMEIAALDKNNPARNVLRVADFYTLSECRDLLFHVQEHTYTLTGIEQLLNRAGLEFIGFEFNDNSTMLQYRRACPDDPHCTDLHSWDLFEQSHKDTFMGMYTFWCRKKQTAGTS